MQYPVPVFASLGEQKMEAAEFLLIELSPETNRVLAETLEMTSNSQRLISFT